MSILRRILLAFGLIIAVGAVGSGTAVLQVDLLSRRLDDATALPLLQVDAAWRVSEAFRQAEASLEMAMAGLHDETQADMARRFEQAAEPIKGLLARAFPVDPAVDHAPVDKLLQEIDTWRAEAAVLLGVGTAATIPAPHVMEKQSQAIRAGLQSLIARSVASADAARAALQARAHQTELLATVFTVVSILLGIGIGVPFARSLSRPLHKLQTRMRGMMDGDLDGPIAGEERRDEVGDIARALRFMRERLTERQRQENEAALHRLQQEQMARDEQAARAAAEQELVVSSLKAGLKHLADGDLAYRLTSAFPAEYDQIRLDYNETLTQLQQLVLGITGSTGALQSGIAGMTQAADQLSQRTEQQAARLAQTAAALQEVTSTVRKTAEGAQRASSIVATTQAEAEQSSLVVQDAVGAMAAIEQASREIGQIVGLIDEIAFQTNLLALNAGVEAARAGDAGRGFAVVASEVRALAQRSAEAAKNIKGLIARSDKQVSSGVGLVGKTGDVLRDIVRQVTEVSAVVIEIASSAHEQARSLAEVNTAIGQMDQFTRENVVMVEQSTASSHELAHETDELAKMTGRFSLAANRSLAAA